MSNPELLIKLRDLHEELAAMEGELSRLEGVDEVAIDALGQLLTDVSVLIDQANEVVLRENVETDSPDRHEVLDRIHQFESEHPKVTRFLSQVTDVLGMIGI